MFGRMIILSVVPTSIFVLKNYMGFYGMDETYDLLTLNVTYGIIFDIMDIREITFLLYKYLFYYYYCIEKL